MKEEKWISWTMQTAKTWEDMEGVMKYTHIDFIDYDHKTLVEYALKLNKLIQQLSDKFSTETIEEIKTIFEELYDYAVHHFEREEIFMEKYGLPNDEMHKIEHERILSILKSSLDEFLKGKVNVSHKLKTQIMNWLIQHINETDYHFFNIKNWNQNLVNASKWEEIKDIISLVGIKEIDAQHKQLTISAMDTMNQLRNNLSDKQIQSLFENFLQIIEYHFNYEEEFMKRYDIKEEEKHEDIHQFFIEQVKAIQNELINDKSTMNERKVWILTWWINHINIIDVKTFDYSNWAIQRINESQTYNEIRDILRFTEVKTIDKDHVDLIEDTFELHQYLSNLSEENAYSKKTKKEVIRRLEKIQMIAAHHFQREERIIKKYAFNDYINHSNEHHLILERLKDLIDNYKNNRIMMSENIKTMILDWWLHHTNNIDYRTFVINPSDEMLNEIQKEEKEAFYGGYKI